MHIHMQQLNHIVVSMLCCFYGESWGSWEFRLISPEAPLDPSFVPQASHAPERWQAGSFSGPQSRSARFSQSFPGDGTKGYHF